VDRLCPCPSLELFEFLKSVLSSTQCNRPALWWLASRTNTRGDAPRNPEIEPMTFECDVEECEYTCHSINALNFHYFDKHGMKHPIRRKVSDTCICCCCLGYYHTRPRLINHLLQSSFKCKMYYGYHVEPLDEVKYYALESRHVAEVRKLAAQGCRPNHSTKRPDRVDGPHTFHA